jgi:two-component system sensor histidine kinase ArlS
MPVRLRITLLFSLLVFFILSLVCAGIYYFSYEGRIQTIKSRLTNRAITTARLLSQREIFDRDLVRRIDSSTTLSLKNKVVQAYNDQNRKVYNYSDVSGDTLRITPELLEKARVEGSFYFIREEKEVIVYPYGSPGPAIVVVTAGEDVDGKETLARLRDILLLSFLVGNMFVLVSGYIFSQRLLRPIKQISEDVAEISAQNLTRRIHTGTTKDEWFQLSSTLNELLNRLQDSFELQRRFISNASHELSTPLTSILSQLEISLQREREAGEYRKVMQSIYQDVQLMSQLTQTLLEFAKASGNTGGLEISLVRIDEIVLDLPGTVQRIHSDYTVKISFGPMPEEEEKLLVFGNHALLATAIRNIVLNACKYADDRQALVSLEINDGDIGLKVSDQGMGIPKDELENIFQPFYRVEEHRTAGGFGLGLSLAQRIIKLHKGSIDVQSEPGMGTIFTIRLPSASRLDGI